MLMCSTVLCDIEYQYISRPTSAFRICQLAGFINIPIVDEYLTLDNGMCVSVKCIL